MRPETDEQLVKIVALTLAEVRLRFRMGLAEYNQLPPAAASVPHGIFWMLRKKSVCVEPCWA